jgi:hypothetical protein
MHSKFRRYKHNVHADSAEQAMGLLLGDNVLRIPMPEAVMARWQAEADRSGFPIDQWVAQRVEGYLANRSYAGEVRAALNELVAIKRTLSLAGTAHDILQSTEQHKQPAPGTTPPVRPEGRRPDEPGPGRP